jgi:hypothetical protein
MSGDGWSIFGRPHVRGRTCGSCKLCCTLVPVQLPDAHKPSGERCRHLRAKGCGIYTTRPRPCEAWSCKWLFDDTTRDIRRPDIAGYAIDPMLDTILVDERPVEVIQVWCDPARRDAHRDPALRAWLASMAERYGYPAIVRWGSAEGMVIVAPSMTDNGEWYEQGGALETEQRMRERLAEVGAKSILDQMTGGPPNAPGGHEGACCFSAARFMANL